MHLQAFKHVRQTYPDLLLVIAPRHPERFAQISTLCTELGYAQVRRSEKSTVKPHTQVWLLDSLGELMAAYSLASIVTIGGSFSNIGGHNPLEPALFKKPIIVGPDMANFSFTQKILAGEPIDVFNYGNHQRDFTYIDDIVEGVVRVLDRIPEPNPDWSGDAPDSATSTAPYRLYNIGNNEPVELMYYIEILEDCLGKKAVKNMLPMQPGDVQATYADVDDLVRDVGYKPATTVAEGMARFVDWYREFYAV